MPENDRTQLMAAQKEEFIALLSSVQREGIDKLLDYLENKSDFYI